MIAFLIGTGFVLTLVVAFVAWALCRVAARADRQRLW
jgi:hypothetical protein